MEEVIKMDIISWIVLGIVVGVIAHLIIKEKSQDGIFRSLVLGVLGALVGGFISNIIFGLGISSVS